MEPEIYFKEKIDYLEEKVKMIEWGFYILLFAVFGVAIIFNLLITSAVPKFKKIFQEMLGGEPLPLLTELVLDYSAYALSIDFLFALILIILCCMGKLKYFLPLGILFTIILFLKISLLYTSLMLPLIHLIKMLGGG